MSRTSAGILAVAAAQIIWGFTTPALKIALGEIPPFSALFIRFGIASLIALPLFFSRPYQRLSRKDLWQLAIITTFGLSLHMAFFAFGLSLSKVVVAALIIAIAPAVDSVAATVFLKEKSDFIHRLGMLVGFFGSLLLILHPILIGKDSLSMDILGTTFLLIAVVLNTVFVVGSKELFAKYTPLTVSSFSFLLATATFLPFALFETLIQPTWLTLVSSNALLAIVFCGVFASFAGYLLFEWGLSRSKVEIIAPLNYLTPIIAFLVGIFLLEEKVDPLILISGLVIILGVWLATFQKPHHHLSKRHRG
ncbi:MAG: hypothetical protein A3F35_00185 [Candidatus Woykebacteria bacterium RIFCSPHIGHO2_12_FULL_45_10]|uniref:EamA domain-containing protein n=1 Tax=Candidatus Woykebacteria bacterium RIFCSPHIGHO2_12_FULL_45_10 TaxID=1802603 RepID=A0A1G1WQ45_9BACT|nr:MAG: hypothetical protein A3F35_00185 [Candidatus Woykebacteria bacterium RIFCSPHIGHO2_12_FULL_45_10]